MVIINQSTSPQARIFELGNEQYNPDFVAQVAAMEAKAAELGKAGE